MVAPTVGRIDEKVSNLSTECVRLGEDIAENRKDIKELWRQIGESRENFARVEGRIENIKEELAAKVELDMTRHLQAQNPQAIPLQSQSSPPALPPSEDEPKPKK